MRLHVYQPLHPVVQPAPMPLFCLHYKNSLHTLLWHVPKLLGPLLLLLVLATGCGERATPTPLPAFPATPTTAATPVANEVTPPSTNDQLVVWLPAFTGVAVEGSSGTLLTNAFHQFEQRNPTVRLDVQVKADVGTASLYNFLRSAQEVAPTILPDMVLLNTQQLWQIVDLGMVVALSEEELLAEANFFSVAQGAVQYRAQTIGIPYTVDVIHLAYDMDTIETPPTTWAELLAGESAIWFPSAEVGTVNSTLLHYISAGGELLEDGSISDPAALEDYFTFLAEAREQSIIPPSLLDLPGYNAVWRAYAEGNTDLAETQVMQFYPNATGITPPGYAPVPTRDGEQVTIAETWAFAILTEDAQRRQHALALIRELLAPEVQGPWSQSVARLPSQPASLAIWTQAEAYRNFVQSLLDDAVGPANGLAFADFARRLHAAQVGIIRGDLNVEAALASMTTIE